MRIYLSKKVIFSEVACLPKLKSITVLLYDFSTVNENALLSLVFDMPLFDFYLSHGLVLDM